MGIVDLAADSPAVIKRPGTVTTLLWMVLCLVAWNAIRMISALANWNLLREFAPHPGPIYILVTAAAWAAGWFAIWRLLRRRHDRARTYALIAAVGYALWWWLDRLLLQEPRPNWPFALTATLVLLAFIASLLHHPRTRAYFLPRENHDQDSPHQETS